VYKHKISFRGAAEHPLSMVVHCSCSRRLTASWQPEFRAGKDLRLTMKAWKELMSVVLNMC